MNNPTSPYSNTSSIRDISKLISSKSLSPVDLIEVTLEQISKLNPILNAFITILEDSARREAKEAEISIKEGKFKGPLHGIPISLKDLIYVKGVRSTSGSKILSNFVPSYDATVVRKLKDAGAIIIGMNNTHEFACGLTNINPHYGSSKHPWDVSRMSGGSSGGSAVGVSARMASGALGTDTSGSIRVPSSFCGLFGLKPTYGRVSKYGVMQLAPSIDHVGPMARSAWDVAALLQAIAGYDEYDASTINVPVPDYVNFISENNDREAKFKLGIPKEYFFDLIDPKVLQTFEKFVDQLNECGVSTIAVNVMETDKIFETWKALRLGESAATHSEWLSSKRHEYGQDVLAMLESGTKVSAVEYIKANTRRQELKNAFLKSMSGLDGLVVPTTIITAPLLNQKVLSINGENVEVYQALSRLTTVFDVTGLPVINVPVDLVDGKLPIGAQLVGRPFDESVILSIAYRYEEYHKTYEKMCPPVIGGFVNG
jgi:aspartyl-tRNA(Asn)/glutamyl-tRNA(Gln) amidotransferase subunit A